MAGAEGTGTDGKFAFKGLPKPEAVPGAPPAEIEGESKAPARAYPAQVRCRAEVP